MNIVIALLIIAVIGYFIYITVKTGARPRYYDKDEKYNAERAQRRQEVDRILEKIQRKGMDSLTEKERKTLDEAANRRD